MPTLLKVESENSFQDSRASARTWRFSRCVFAGANRPERNWSPKAAMGLIRKSGFDCCENGRQVTVPTRSFYLTGQLAAKGFTGDGANSLSWRRRIAECWDQMTSVTRTGVQSTSSFSLRV